MSPFVKASIFSALVILGVTAAVRPRSSTVAPLADDQGFRSVALKVHNHYRTQYSTSPLELDPELNKLAHAHAEKLAGLGRLSPSNSGFHENLWSHRGELLPLAKDCKYAIKNWYTGSKTPGNVDSSVDHSVLRSDSVKRVGFGVGTTETNGEGYSVVVAFYS